MAGCFRSSLPSRWWLWRRLRAFGLGKGVVTAASYDYGNTFLIVAGLLNMLVVLDAYDIALGRKG